MPKAAKVQDLKKEMRELKIAMIYSALQRTQGNVLQAAKLLNINRTTLIYNMKRYAIRYGQESPSTALADHVQ